MTIPTEFGGLGFSQQQYLKTMEILGGHDASVAVFVNAHHSHRRPRAAAVRHEGAAGEVAAGPGRRLEALRLRADRAGGRLRRRQRADHRHADRGRLRVHPQRHEALHHQRRHRPRPDRDGPHARRRTAKSEGDGVPGHAGHAGLRGGRGAEPKCGIRGTATGKLRFTNMRVPKENILGQLGNGLQAALTVLNFGRMTFGATCTGARQGLPQGDDRARQDARAVPAAARRVRAGQEEDRLRGGPLPSRWRRRRPSAPRSSTAGRRTTCSRRRSSRCSPPSTCGPIVNDTLQVYGGKGYFSRPADRAVDARRPHQHHRRRGERRAEGVHRRGRLPRARGCT